MKHKVYKRQIEKLEDGSVEDFNRLQNFPTHKLRGVEVKRCLGVLVYETTINQNCRQTLSEFNG